MLLHDILEPCVFFRRRHRFFVHHMSFNEREMMRFEDAAVAEGHGVLQQALQFVHISRPEMLLQLPHCFVGDADSRFAIDRGHRLKKMAGKLWQIFDPFAQWRQGDIDCGQPLVELASKTSGGSQCPQVL